MFFLLCVLLCQYMSFLTSGHKKTRHWVTRFTMNDYLEQLLSLCGEDDFVTFGFDAEHLFKDGFDDGDKHCCFLRGR